MCLCFAHVAARRVFPTSRCLQRWDNSQQTTPAPFPHSCFALLPSALLPSSMLHQHCLPPLSPFLYHHHLPTPPQRTTRTHVKLWVELGVFWLPCLPVRRALRWRKHGCPPLPLIHFLLSGLASQTRSGCHDVQQPTLHRNRPWYQKPLITLEIMGLPACC